MRARISVIGMAIASALVVGCNAEQAQDPAGGESSVAQAATLTAKDNITIGGVDYRRQFPATCVVTEGGVDKMIVAGGYDQTGAATTEIFKFNPAAGAGSQWALLTVSLGVARGEAEAVRMPGSTTQCMIVGGKGSIAGVALNTVELLDVSVPSVTAKAGITIGGVNRPRANFKLSQCGSGANAKLIATSGWNVTTPTYYTAVDVYSITGNSWSKLTDLATARSYFALAAKDANYTNFLIAGGKNSGGTIENTVELLTVDASCTLVKMCTPKTVDNGGTSTTLGTVRWETEAFFKDNTPATDTFVVAAGSATAGETDALSSTDEITVTTWNPAAMHTCVATQANGSALSTARRRPVLAADYGFAKFGIAGGIAANGQSVGKLQVWDASAGAPAWSAEDSFIDPRFGLAAAYLPSRTKVSVSSGVKLLSGNVLEILKSTEEQ